MVTFIALLRGINVGGHKKIPMADLRDLCTGLRLADVQTYIQSGNILFGSAERAADLEAQLERALAARFGFPVDTLVRAATGWPALVAANPFPDESQSQPNLVMMLLAKRTPPAAALAEAAATLQARAQDGERVVPATDALWMYYANGAGRSKLSPALIDRAVGSPVTARNIRTVQTLGAMAGVLPGGA